MSATETEWQPGDPLMPDEGCGGGTTVWMSEVTREATIAADTGLTPPWWRPTAPAPLLGGWTRHCKACDVQWRGPQPCWNCGGEVRP